MELDAIQRFIKDYSTLSKTGKIIVLCWIPSHVGISDNEKADSSEDCPLSMSTSMKILATDLVPSLMKLISENWQQFWNSCTGNKLQVIRPTVGGYQQKSSLCRRDEVVTVHYLR